MLPKAAPPKVAPPPKAAGAPKPPPGLLLKPPNDEPKPPPLGGDPKPEGCPNSGLAPKDAEPPNAGADCCGDPNTDGLSPPPNAGACGLPNAWPVGDGVLKLPPVVLPNIDEACVVAVWPNPVDPNPPSVLPLPPDQKLVAGFC